MSSSSSPADTSGVVPLRRVLWAATAVVIAVWALVLAFWRPAPFTLTFDDAYYYFAIARNIVDGHGSSFDQLNLTNGYHPLWMALCMVPFALGLDDSAAARAILLFQLVVCWGGTLALLSSLVGDAVDAKVPGRGASATAARGRSGWVTGSVVAVFVLLAANPFVVKVFVNGLESGLVALTQAAVLLVVVRRGGRVLTGTGRSERLVLAALLSLAFLARTDAGLLVAVLAMWGLAELLGSRGTGSGPRRVSGAVVLPMVEAFGPVAVVAALYLASNRIWFGTWLQVSGLVKRAPLTPGRLVLALVLVAVAFGLARHAFRRLHGAPARRQPKLVTTGRLGLATGWYGAFCVLLLTYYVVLQTQQWLWYFAPVVLYVVLLATTTAADLAAGALAEAPAGRSPGAAVAPVVAILGVPLLLAFVLQLRTFVDPNLRSIQEANRDAGVAIRATLPEDAVLASWDAGVVGYYSHRRIVNLDGVVNSLEFYEAGRDGRLGPFLDADGVTWIVNHGEPVDGQDPDIARFVRSVWGDDVAREVTLERTFPFRYSGTTTGSGGLQGGGTRELAVFLYRLPPVAQR